MTFSLNGEGNPFGIAAIFHVLSYIGMETEDSRCVRFCGRNARKGERRLEKKISLLFDFHRFEQNKDLQAVIDAVHSRYTARKLTDDEAEWVAAAGTPESSLKRTRPEDKWK